MLSLTTIVAAAATTDAAAVIAATAAAIGTTTATVTATTTNFQDKRESLSNCKIFGLRYRLLNRRILSDDLYMTFTRQW